MNLIFDIETNGLLDKVTKLHTIAVYDLDTEKIESSTPHNHQGILDKLQKADIVIGHNILKYDVPVLQKLYPNFKVKKIYDTLLVSKLAFPDIGIMDDINIYKGTFPKSLRGSYSLKAWGYRLGVLKGTYCEQENAWNQYSEEMRAYCEDDVRVTLALYKCLQKKKVAQSAIDLEHNFAQIIFNQEVRGVCFDTEKAIELASTLTEEKTKLETQLQKTFKPKVIRTPFTPKANNKAKGYVKGVTIYKEKVIPFNPSSRDMIAERLMEMGWKPKAFTIKENKPVINEEILEGITDIPEAEVLKQYFRCTKVFGQLVDGKNAWLKLLSGDCIHGRVDTIGAVTGRCTHSNPNLAQVPSPRAYKGEECRRLFRARKGYLLIGTDASGLELRCLAHFMKDPHYVHEILNGDIHTKNQISAGLPTRNDAKRFIYAFIYGGGDKMIGELVGGKSKQGKEIKAKFLSSLPTLKKLMDNVKSVINNRGFLYGLDRRKLKIRESYKGLNVLLQSAGAVVMKKALCILNDDLTANGMSVFNWADYCKGKRDFDIAFVLNVHDEYQAEVKPQFEEIYKKLAVDAIRKAGEYFNFYCPLDGEAKVGKDWFDTH